MRTLTTLTGNSQKLDGGAMFGNAPKALWQRWMPVSCKPWFSSKRSMVCVKAFSLSVPARSIR